MRDEFIKTIEGYDSSAKAYSETIVKLSNYDETYDFLADCLKENASILDLACGPANISSYLLQHKRLMNITGIDLSQNMIDIAKKNVPQGTFFCADVVEYRSKEKYDAAIIGFAIPYLNMQEIETFLSNTEFNLNHGAYLYISFMNGYKEGYENPSFNQEVELYIHYHQKTSIEQLLKKLNFTIIKQWELDYQESDGSITTDVILIARKRDIKMYDVNQDIY